MCLRCTTLLLFLSVDPTMACRLGGGLFFLVHFTFQYGPNSQSLLCRPMNRKVENDPFLVGCATSSCESHLSRY